jgi:hypothetical protein
LPQLAFVPAQPVSAQSRNEAAATIAHARAELREIAGILAEPQPQSQPPRRRARLATMPSKTDTLFPL